MGARSSVRKLGRKSDISCTAVSAPFSTRRSYCSYFMDEVNEAQRDDAGLGLVLDLSRTCVLKH